MTKRQKQTTILIMFSGGIDSTYMLYKYLTETEYKIHVHHISLRNSIEPKWRQEDSSSSRVIAFCLANYRQFDYSESRLDFMDFKTIGCDSDVILLMAQKVAQNIKGKSEVAIGWNMHSFAINYRYVHTEIYTNIWESLLNNCSPGKHNRISHKLRFPLKTITKKGMIRNMPHELFNLTWWCRKPVFVSDNKTEAEPCRVCHACKQAAGE